MRRSCRLFLLLGAVLFLLPFSASGDEPFSGWRGNGTGLWPRAQPPLHWGRTPRGAMDGLRASAAKPRDKNPGEAPLVEKGLIRDWLVLGPLSVKDSVRDFEQDLLGGEATLEPDTGQKTKEKEWQAATVPPDDMTVFGNAEMPWLDLAKVFGFQNNQVAHAHAYLYSPRGGPVRVVMDHAFGMKAWVNGKVVYASPQRGMAMTNYPNLSRHELNHWDQPAPHFQAQLQPGWNRLLLKLTTPNVEAHREMRCSLRLMDPPNVPYESKNILWMTPLPQRSTSTPLLVGDRLFVHAEPDELLCLDKNSGKVLWSAAANYFEALSPTERQALPALATKVDPLVAKLRQETDKIQRTRLRAHIQKNLLEIDPKRFKIKADGHFESHFGIVGFTMPTPVCDGKHVYVWNGMGVAACYDFDGQRRWIARIPLEELSYGSSPALADGVLVVFDQGLHGLDAATGKYLWQQKKNKHNVAALQAVNFNGHNVIVTQRGNLVNPKNGQMLYQQEGSGAAGDSGWAPPTILGHRMYLPKYGVQSLTVQDFSKVQPGQWAPEIIKHIELPPEVSRGPGGKWVDPWTAGSPLIHDDIAYLHDIYQRLYAVDLKTGKMLYRQVMEMQGYMHYNAVPVAASLALVGRHILACDNQGTILMLHPGPKYQVAARNHIGTQLKRTLPLPGQETLCYAPPLAEGGRLYVRGEAFMYCIGEK
jgi:outer membrane protein assembly factor BamB